jgi:hypothetical protein
MPILIDIEDQKSLSSMLSFIEKSQANPNHDYSSQMKDLSRRIIILANKILGTNFEDPSLAASKLLRIYKKYVLNEISHAKNLVELGEIMHKAPDSWGKLSMFPEISNALIAQKNVLKERAYIIGLTLSERQEYINNCEYYKKPQLSWAQNHQAQVLAMQALNPCCLDKLTISELFNKSLEVSNYLLRRTKEHKSGVKLTDVEYSLYVEMHNQVKTKLMQEYAGFIKNLGDLSKQEQLKVLCEANGDFAKQITDEYMNINSYNVSQHLLMLDACKILVNNARDELKVAPRLMLVSYSRSSEVSTTVATMDNYAEPIADIAYDKKFRFA